MFPAHFATVPRDLVDRVAIWLNRPLHDDPRPNIVWAHLDIDQPDLMWMSDAERRNAIDMFVFVSHWQADRFRLLYGVKPERSTVIRNAIPVGPEPVKADGPVRVIYASAPYRGLDVLLAAWADLRPAGAELHIYSSMQLYGKPDGDAKYRHLYDFARALPGVTYSAGVENSVLLQRMRDAHVLVYPATMRETSCRVVMEGMMAGMRVVCPALGALPETSAGLVDLYDWTPDVSAHIRLFAAQLAAAIADPRPHPLARPYALSLYDETRRPAQWIALIERVLARRAEATG